MNPPPLTANSINYWKNGTELSSEISGIAFVDGQCNQRLANGSLRIIQTNHKQRLPTPTTPEIVAQKACTNYFPYS